MENIGCIVYNVKNGYHTDFPISTLRKVFSKCSPNNVLEK